MVNTKIKYLLILLCLFCVSITPAYSAVLNTEEECMFEKLDSLLKIKDIFEAQKRLEIVEAQSKLNLAQTLRDQYNTTSHLYTLYETYKYDSAYLYSQKMYAIALEMQDVKRISEARMIMAYSNLLAGLFLESKNILDSIEISNLDRNYLTLYYSIWAKLYLDMADLIKVNPYYDEYNKLSIDYNRKVMNLLKGDSVNIIPHQANIYKCEHQYEKAVLLLENYLHNNELDERTKTLTRGGIGQFYLILGDTINAIPHLIYAAMNDVKSVNKETSALYLLANVLYKQGDINRAYLYAKASLDDANIFNARQRQIEIGNVLPIIEQSRYALIQKEKDILFKYSLLVSLLSILLVVSIMFIAHQFNLLKKAQKMIQEQNNTLVEVNDKLKEVNRIKDEYIGRFFTRNFSLINEIEDLQKRLTRKILSKQYGDALEIVKNIDIHKKMDNSLASFDHVFLKLFPDYIKHYNSLFSEQNRVKPTEEGILTTEMRIFALIRLGISDSDQIAKLLGYSTNTINTYKTKVKNKSLLPNEEFESRIMQI